MHPFRLYIVTSSLTLPSFQSFYIFRYGLLIYVFNSGDLHCNPHWTTVIIKAIQTDRIWKVSTTKIYQKEPLDLLLNFDSFRFQIILSLTDPTADWPYMQIELCYMNRYYASQEIIFFTFTLE